MIKIFILLNLIFFQYKRDIDLWFLDSEIKTEVEKGVKFTVIIFDIINRKEYIEYLLRDNFEKRIRFDKLNKS